MIDCETRLKTYQNLLRDRLPEKRLLHCLSVASQAMEIGVPLGLDSMALQTAGLLHDLCRALDNETMLAQARMFGIPIDSVSLQKPMLLHGPVAAAWCQRELGINDAGVIEAIYWHTTGSPGMGRLAQVLYVADFCEPLRKYPEAAEAREVLRLEGFDAALRYTARTKYEFARKKEVSHPGTTAFWNWVQAGMPKVLESI